MHKSGSALLAVILLSGIMLIYINRAMQSSMHLSLFAQERMQYNHMQTCVRLAKTWAKTLCRLYSSRLDAGYPVHVKSDPICMNQQNYVVKIILEADKKNMVVITTAHNGKEKLINRISL